MATVFLFTPPFTQLNTPYPATAYLKGFLNTRGIPSFQADLGIEVIRKLFCKSGLQQVFAMNLPEGTSANALRMNRLKDRYLQTIDPVMQFLEGSQPTLAHRIAQRGFLPEASRFAELPTLEEAFGSMGKHDQARYLATLYLEDLSDYIQEIVDPHFGFSRYAESLGRSANLFDELQETLQQPLGQIDQIMLQRLEEYIQQLQPRLVAISVPFPGNLLAAFRCAQWIRAHHPQLKVAMGGGFPNTELRSLKDPRVFDYVHYVTLDDGEAPVEQLVRLIEVTISEEALKRTFLCRNGEVVYINSSTCADYAQAQTGTPDYSDLLLNQYISVIELLNPMHSLWNNGRWNKLTMAHGCYWGKCTFCDISLPYIEAYEPLTAAVIADRMEALMQQTGTNGFHFVDEAAPPALMKAVALEIIRRKLVVSWWTNIRFEKSFTRDLCFLLKESGCIGVSGGLEVASDRLLQLIQKGISVAQVARVNRNFTEAGIMVHAYLMYGFPTQTAQETVDSLEMVRQMFEAGILQSAFWHRFALTTHSPVGKKPEQFGIVSHPHPDIQFADNDVVFDDPTGADHELFAFGLKKSLHNFMHGIGLDTPVHKWFESKQPKTSVAADYIKSQLELPTDTPSDSARCYFTGNLPQFEVIQKSKKGQTWEMMELQFDTPGGTVQCRISAGEGKWFFELLQQLQLPEWEGGMKLAQLRSSYEEAGLPDFDLFWFNKPVNSLYKAGLYLI